MNNYSIIEADVESDKNDIISLLQHAEWNQSYNKAKYEWKYLNAPYGKARCWFAIDNSSNAIIGISSLFPRKMYIDNKPVITFTLGDFYVDKNYRGFGPAISLQKTIYAAVKSLNEKQIIFGIANKQAFYISEKVGYINNGVVNQYIKPLQLSKLVEYKKQYPKILKIKPFQKLLEMLFNITAKEQYYNKRNNVTFEDKEFFDHHFNKVWEKARHGFHIISEKSAQMLNWKYTDRPDKDYKVFCIKENNSLLGYIVYAEINNNHQIYDLCFIKNKSVLSDLLLEFSLFSRRKNRSAIIFYFLGDTHIIQEFRKFNFHKISYNINNLMIAPIGFTTDQINFTKNLLHWNLVLGDKY